MPKAKDRCVARGRAFGVLELPEHMPMPEATLTLNLAMRDTEASRQRHLRQVADRRR